MKKLTLILFLAAIAAVGAVVAVLPAGSGQGPPPLSVHVEERTQTSMSFQEFYPAPEHGFRITFVDGVATYDGAGLTKGQAKALDAAAGGLCKTRTDLPPGLGNAAKKTPDHAAIDALASLDCSVSSVILEVDEAGSLAGFVGTTDASQVDDLQSQLGGGVIVEWDLAGTSPRPGS